jgi:hypothetical protein
MTSDLVIVSPVVDDSALNMSRFPLFVSSGTRVWEKFWEMVGETTEGTIDEMFETMIGEMFEAIIGEMFEAMIGELIGMMIRIVPNDATNAVSEN